MLFTVFFYKVLQAGLTDGHPVGKFVLVADRAFGLIDLTSVFRVRAGIHQENRTGEREHRRDARALDDGGEGGIHETGVVLKGVITAVAYDDGLVANIGFLWKKRIIEAVLPVKNLARFQLLYNGNILNLELSFKNQANRLDNSRNIMKVLVYPIEGSVIYFNNNNQNNDINNNNFQNKNVIRGILDIKLSEIKNNYVDLFFTVVKDGIDVYINHKKVNMIIREGHWKIDYFFERDGQYSFEIVMNF